LFTENEKSPFKSDRADPFTKKRLLALADRYDGQKATAERRNPSEPDELIASVVDAVARGYFQHVLRKKLRRGDS